MSGRTTTDGLRFRWTIKRTMWSIVAFALLLTAVRWEEGWLILFAYLATCGAILSRNGWGGEFIGAQIGGAAGCLLSYAVGAIEFSLYPDLIRWDYLQGRITILAVGSVPIGVIAGFVVWLLRK